MSAAPVPVSEGTTSAQRILRTIPLAALALALAGCGGGGHTQAPDAGPVRVTAYGDSTQRAQGNPHAASRPGFVIENKGVSGSTSSQLLAGWGAEMAASGAAGVVVNHGLNDGALTTAQYRDTLRALVDAARARGKWVILEEPNAADPHSTFDVAAFDARRVAMRELASHMGVYFCAQPRVPLMDGAHPTPEGYALKATRLAQCIGEVVS